MIEQDKPLRRCDRRCIANVGGQCAVADCRGPVGQIPMGPNRTLESSARYYQYMRSAFDDYFGEGCMDDGTEE